MKANSSFRARLAVAAACLIASTTLGCAQYGPVSKPAYDYATALYSMSNRKDATKLPVVTAQIRTAREAGEITADEAAYLDEIVVMATGGDWQTAATSSRTMMVEQIR